MAEIRHRQDNVYRSYYVPVRRFVGIMMQYVNDEPNYV